MLRKNSRLEVKTRYIGSVDDYQRSWRPWNINRVYSDEINMPDAKFCCSRAIRWTRKKKYVLEALWFEKFKEILNFV